ncbi:MAG: D-alanine--D-alanine ligase [Chloroflexi bacterium]|nr:D-alanine--D-alanine ligase [Chloroflexota bacterium]
MTEKKIKIGILLGGRSSEHEVSLMSARSIIQMLDPQKYQVTQIGITPAGQWMVGENVIDRMLAREYDALTPAALLPEPGESALYRQQITTQGKLLEVFEPLDVIFPVLHGTFGEDGTLQGLFEIVNIAYVGAGVLASSVGMDKALFKDIMRTHNLPITPSVLATRSEVEHQMEQVIARAEGALSYPLFVKPANMGSSVGVSKCHNRSDLLEGLMDAMQYDRRVLIEKGVNAREIEISVLGNEDPQVSIPGEIRPRDEFYSYAAKYIDDDTELLIPAPLEASTVAQIQNCALRAYKAIDCAGMARVDFFVDKDNSQVYINEVNTIPGFTKISMYPKLWEASGIPYPKLLDRLVELAFERKAERDRTEYRYRGEA